MAAQQPQTIQKAERSIVEGKVSESDQIGQFLVNHIPIETTASTRFLSLHGQTEITADSLRSAAQSGACVRVAGMSLPSRTALVADSVSLCADIDQTSKLSGIGVIEKVISLTPQPVFQADGYRIRAVPDAAVTYRGNIKTLADITPGIWVRFAAKPDSTGVLIASQLDFLAPKMTSAKTGNTSTAPVGTTISAMERPARPSQPDIVNESGSLGELHGRFTSDQSNRGWHKLTRDTSAQDRVLRIGMKVVPEYQKRLAADDAAKIDFRFFVVEDRWIPTYIPGALGVVLVPRAVVERLKSDDQLAAVLADAVAFHLKLQMSNIFSTRLLGAGAEVASWISVLTMESAAGAFVVGGVAKGIVDHEVELRLEEERARVALGLMADSGFDPWQAPDAWRLLNANKVPKDLSRLSYPHVSKYQLKILVLEYPFAGPDATETSSVKAAVASN